MKVGKFLFSIDNKATMSKEGLNLVNTHIEYIKEQIYEKEPVIFYNDRFTLQKTNNKNVIDIQESIGEISQKIFINLNFWMAIKIRIAGLKNIIKYLEDKK